MTRSDDIVTNRTPGPEPARWPRPFVRRAAGAACALLLLWGCGEHEFHPPDTEERIAAAAARYSQEMFDTVTWESDEDRLFAGNLVYATTCRRCHGPLGRGETEYARNRGLTVPSLVEPEWALSEFPDSVRYRIFVGHEGGMPVFQLSGLSPAEIDAVTAYVLFQLRPDVLGSGEASGPGTGGSSGP